jgi:hypothetical protein
MMMLSKRSGRRIEASAPIIALTITVGKQHRLLASAADVHVKALVDVHSPPFW